METQYHFCLVFLVEVLSRTLTCYGGEHAADMCRFGSFLRFLRRNKSEVLTGARTETMHIYPEKAACFRNHPQDELATILDETLKEKVDRPWYPIPFGMIRVIPV